ncbi:MAG: nodulation efficiency protein NfeD, partial [Planctomycetia bacterium]|nr:nodulation efficiency protein NfeD [Planctomycetia bacterium]
MSPLVWILMLVALGLTLVLLEVFVPSGGVLGLLAVLALGAGVVTA